MKKIIWFLTAAALVLSLVLTASGDSAIDILYKDVQTPFSISRTGEIARMFVSVLGEAEAVPAASVTGIMSLGEREYISIDVDKDDNMRLVIRDGETAYCWNVNPGLQQTIARRAFTSSVPCYYTDEEIGKVFYSDLMKSGPFGSFETFDEFLDTIDRIQEAKAMKRLTENKMEGDRFLALFARTEFGDSVETVAEEYGITEREERGGEVTLTCSDSALFRELSDGLEKSVVYIQFIFTNDKLTGCSLMAGEPDGNFTYCKAYMTAIYGEPAADPENMPENGNSYAWEKDNMQIRITEIGGAITVIQYVLK